MCSSLSPSFPVSGGGDTAMAAGHHHRKTQKESQITPKRSSFNSKHESAFEFFVLFFFSYEFCF
jgi:hypothetical protein